jgi:hypothetical protein
MGRTQPRFNMPLEQRREIGVYSRGAFVVVCFEGFAQCATLTSQPVEVNLISDIGAKHDLGRGR